jgi:predicted RNase H-like HicB family nuclease
MSRGLTKKRGKMDIQFTTQILKEGDTFVAYAPELDLSSCGKTIQEAKAHLAEAVTLFIEEAQRMGTLQDILEEAGYTKEAAGWKAPEIVVQEKTRLALMR